MGDVTSIGQDPATAAQFELVTAIKATGKFGDGLRQEGSNGHEFMFHCPICIKDDGKGEGHRPHLRVARATAAGRTTPYYGCRTHDSPADFSRIRKALLAAGIPGTLLVAKGANAKALAAGRTGGLAAGLHAEFKSRPEGLGETDPIPEERIERWKAALSGTGSHAQRARDYLASRGLTEDLVAAAEFGLAGSKLILPMRGADGTAVLARYRIIKANLTASPWRPVPHHNLVNPETGKRITYGAPTRLYGVRELALERERGEVGADGLPRPAWVTAGEFDRLTLLGAGCLSVSPTNGEGSLPRLEDAEYLIGREVIICFDCDKAGRRGAHKFAVALAKLGVEPIRIVDLNADRDDGYDVTDFFAEFDSDDGAYNAMGLLSDKASLTPAFELSAVDTDEGLPVTDTEAAEALLRRHPGEMLFVDTGRARSGYWIVWDGNRWLRDADGIAERWVVELGREYIPAAREAYLAARASEDGSAGALADLRRVEKLLDDGKIASVLSRARTTQSGITIGPETLDNDGRLLVVGNGVLELREDGVKLRSGKQDDLATHSTGTFYDAKARAAAWDDFLATFLPDDELREFVGRVLGYCLLGRNPDGMIFHFHGKTRTGKSTLLRAVSRALGDYAKPFDLTALRGKFETGPREDIADIMNARLAYVSELSSAWELHADQMKRLSGMDKISYARKYENQQTRYPDFTAVLAANGMPRIKGGDQALRGRFVTVPFNVSVPERSQKSDALDNDVAAEAVLSWLVRGYKRYCKYGIQNESWPGAVVEATMGSHAVMDDVDEFIIDCCEVDREYYAPTSAFYPAYRHWCEEAGIPRSDVQKRQLFMEALTDRGYLMRQRRVDGKVTKVRLGIRLNPGYTAMSFG